MKPELPYLAAGAVAIIGGTRREGHFPAKGLNAVVGTTILVVAASATANTRVAPLVHAVGLLVLMAAIYGATRAYQTPKAKAKP